ncbi:capsule biosynthesis protein [Chitinophaga caeni]|uniref:Capsule biosynthesis protein n=1 Tax=Chitinophaga caeni TaxID=2029983 RepID=A0A291QQZ3_9BACT|nr:SLBB domain-containing protein [Chitinophaga caeni]ATL46254.1 capsule biosynthesis protein [Chitinophaga caeni]
MKKLLLVQLLLLFMSITAMAQVPTVDPEALKQVNIDQLSDAQIKQIVTEMQKNGVTLDNIDSYAEAKGIPAAQVSKLKQRIRTLNLEGDLSAANKGNADNNLYDGERSVDWEAGGQTKPSKKGVQSKVYGAQLFSNKNLTFEPNLRMATPPNYRLATGDELLIDVYGYNETQMRLKVNAEGYIRVPNLGPIYVNGLTIEDATRRITKQLATIYSAINTGNTSVQVNLGNIRSIRVLLIGEIETPGSYTLPSLATIANALYVSGGPNNNGSFRDIQLIRNGQPVVTFDLYDFLNKGDLSNNLVLQDQDIIKVNPYQTRVELSGGVKTPGIFEVKPGETLKDVIRYAGGYTDAAYKELIRGFRINNREREVIDIPQAEIATYELHSGDKFEVDSVLNRFSNRVVISGAVFHPGNYSLESGMTIKDLISKADGVREEASLTRGLIRRFKEDMTPQMINFNVKDVLSGASNIQLRREDSVIIYNKFELQEDFTVHISGLVNIPGRFSYAEGMQLEDLILLAGGLQDAASLQRVEISRRIRSQENTGNDTALAIIQHFDITPGMAVSNEMTHFELQPFDEVMVRKSPSYTEQADVNIGGEVLYPGSYTINSKKERISDLIRRSGGLRPDAYAEGAVMVRRTFVNASDSVLLHNKLEVYYNKLEDSASVNRFKSDVQRNMQLVNIDLPAILKKPGSKDDLFLEEGDIIRVPKKLQTVQVFGEIYFPKKIRFTKENSFRDYVRGAGGFTAQALKRRSYIVYANGTVKGTKKVLFFNSYPKLKPGAEIYVPAKASQRGLSGQEVLGISTGVASLALIITTIINNL